MEVNRFNGVEGTALRAYNRAVMSHNLLQDFGLSAAKDYLEGFTQAEKKQIFIIISLIKSKGADVARKMVTSIEDKANGSN